MPKLDHYAAERKASSKKVQQEILEDAKHEYPDVSEDERKSQSLIARCMSIPFCNQRGSEGALRISLTSMFNQGKAQEVAAAESV